MDASYTVSLTEYVPSCRVRVYPSAQYSFFTSSENVPPEMDFFFTSTLPVKLPLRMDILEFGAVTAVGPSTVPPTIEIALPLLPLMAVINVSVPSPRSASTLPPFIMNVPETLTARLPRFASQRIAPPLNVTDAPFPIFSALPAFAIPSVVMVPPFIVRLPLPSTLTTSPEVPV